MQIEINPDNFDKAYRFVEDTISDHDVSDEVASETLLIFEALFQAILDQAGETGVVLYISDKTRLGDMSLHFAYEGKMFLPDIGGDDSIEGRLLTAHDDKLDYSYRSGYNVIHLSVRRRNRNLLIACTIALILAVLVYLPVYFLVDSATQKTIFEGYIFPLEQFYANAVMLVGVPMTFFSLLKNLTDTYIISEREDGIPRLQVKTLVTSCVAIVLAIIASFVLVSISISSSENIGFGAIGNTHSFAEIMNSLLPSSIFDAFESLSPIPIILIALLLTYALCSTGKHFDALRKAMEACYSLVSRMLRVVLAGLPFFCFVALEDVLLDTGFESLLFIMAAAFAVVLSLSLLFASYAIRLKHAGIAPVAFARKLGPLIRENFEIGSVIDAVPFNVRYCARFLNIPRKLTEKAMPVLAQVNLDGNCFILMMITCVFVYDAELALSWVDLVAIATLILFLSFGAPNQPGSILIGALIITNYLGSYGMLCLAIYAEAFMGSLLNMTNVLGNIVLLAIEQKKFESLEAENSVLE